MAAALEEQKRVIRDVWKHNLEEEMIRMRDIAEDYPYVAMDTEFPGVVAKPQGPFRTPKEYNYQTVKCNVDLLKVIQIGLTFADECGNRPDGVCTWQFNFAFDLVQDLYAQDSIDFLRLCGIDFDRHTTEGIDVQDFAEVLMTSGIVLDASVHWISFHGSYDFGYFLKILTCQPLPDEEDGFFDLLRAYFPSLYDIKFLLRSVEDLRPTWASSLNRLADYMSVQRVGQEHQAGSDSLVTCILFFKLIDIHFGNQIDDSKFCGQIYGLGEGASAESSQALDSHRSPSPVGVPNGTEAGVNGVGHKMTLGLVDSMGQQYPLSTMSNPAIHVNSGPRPMYA
jgi:CCR4-NOT transcription complex subunit 7/8